MTHTRFRLCENSNYIQKVASAWLDNLCHSRFFHIKQAFSEINLSFYAVLFGNESIILFICLPWKIILPKRLCGLSVFIRRCVKLHVI